MTMCQCARVISFGNLCVGISSIIYAMFWLIGIYLSGFSYYWPFLILIAFFVFSGIKMMLLEFESEKVEDFLTVWFGFHGNGIGKGIFVNMMGGISLLFSMMKFSIFGYDETFPLYVCFIFSCALAFWGVLLIVVDLSCVKRNYEEF